LPAVLVVVPIGVVWSYLKTTDELALRALALYYDPAFPLEGSPSRFLIERTLIDWFGLFLIMPLFVPILISSHAIAGEKEKRTLEPLPASPVTPAELLVGKSMASLTPALAVSWAAFILFAVGVDWITREMLLPNAMWLFGIFVLAPLFAFFGNGIAVLISARMGDARLAQQMAGLFVLPVLGMVGGQLAGFLRAGTAYYALQGAVIFLADVGLVIASVRVFDRERLISKWT
jgi:ABC-type transport system involved in multi-copper enzyme maturation permease subunit